ncbi:MAG TPA: type II toxin-antitoxin system VapC family toxin [Sedimentisphaerales bacterium]|nr:type II toxin-antitoxin system VapC family toxin [Sedimentisphaerales bacterium]HRS09851.1 type II toxin-antitoxin system VapC family toxin [Sedimentisphaerales bacterium]HRV46499.1 type II toxin-antitoxin system VapC family toxin [Sedimentisphaerales bacterium]
MNLVDSSGWLEYFAEGPNAPFFAPAVEDTAHLLVSTINLYEVFKRVFQQRGEHAALQAVALMQQGTVVDVTAPISMEAAKISAEMKLHMADSLILATARAYDAIVWTQDSDLDGLSSVRYVGRHHPDGGAR